MMVRYCGKRRPLYRRLFIAITLALFGYHQAAHAGENIEFNTDILDINEKQTFDISRFSRTGFTLPGTYSLVIRINKQDLPEQSVTFIAPENDPKGSEPCLTPEQVALFGLKEEVATRLRWTHDGKCLDPLSIEGMQTKSDVGNSQLYISIPQAWLEYSNEYWDPPSRWSEGISGLIFDYNLNLQATNQQDSDDIRSLTSNGTTGANLGPWRLRADWQSRLEKNSNDNAQSPKAWEWTRFYAYRALPKLGARLSAGEESLSSAIFDSFSFTGLSLYSDDNMLPPNLRGYAPEITGIARSNARVTISQQGRVLYETQVASGPFRIQDLNDSVSGQLDVLVEEQDGSEQRFQVNTATIPYLTRPGSLRYKLSAGRPSDYEHNINGPTFATGELSWGVSNGWSLFSGAIGSEKYRALALGVGRDLYAFGAISFDVTQSHADLDRQGKKQGRSYRINYSKRFDEIDSQITFAGYRFSEKDFMSMGEFLDATRNGQLNVGDSKETYTISFNKQFRDAGLSAYINYSLQTYWDQQDSKRYSLSLAKYFDLGRFKNISLSLSAYRDESLGRRDNGAYLSLSLPLSNGATVSYDTNTASYGDTSHQASYRDRIGENDDYRVSVGTSGQEALVNGNYNHEGSVVQTNLNASYQGSKYSAVGLSIRGGATATLNGAALHRSSTSGGTRLLIDTDGVADIPVRVYGSASRSNAFGKVVLTDVNSYYRNKASVDINALPDNAEVSNSVVEATLTEGAIGYRRFGVVAGEKAMAIIRLVDGSVPPFGAQVFNSKEQEVGIVGDDGSVWLSGLNAGETMTVRWNNQPQCAIDIPKKLVVDPLNSLLMPCRLLSATQ